MATTVIDALLVTLGLDASDFKKGSDDVAKGQKKIADTSGQSAKAIEQQEKKLGDAQSKRTKELEARSKQMVQGFSKIRNEALAMFAVFAGGVGLKNFLVNTLTAEAGLSRMSANLNMSATDLAMWQLANERAGGSIEGMTAQIKEASGELAKLQTGGGSEKIAALFKWSAMSGVTLNINDLKTGSDVLLARSKALQALSKIDISKARVAAEEMGISEDTFNLMKQGPEVIEKQRLAQKRLAAEMARNAPAAEEFRKKWNDLTHTLEAATIKILPKLMPYLDKFANWFISIIPVVERFFQKLDKAVASIGGWQTVLIALLALKVLSFAGDMVILAGSITRVAAALALIGNMAWVMTLIKALGPLALLLHSGDLNEGEEEELAKKRANTPGYDKKGNRIGNNPANIRYGAFAKSLGATGADKDGYAMFPTEEAGKNAARALIKRNAEAAANMPQGAAAAMPGSPGNSTSTTDIKIGAVNVQTQATDAPGIAKSIGGALAQYSFVAQANRGLA